MTYPFTPGERLTAADLNAALDKARDDATAAAGGSALTPEGFGATGDGATDDFAAIQAAIDAAAAQRRPLALRPRVYATSQCLTVPSFAVILGNGATIRRLPGGDGRVMQSTDALALFQNPDPPLNAGSNGVVVNDLLLDAFNWAGGTHAWPRSAQQQTNLGGLSPDLCNALNWWGHGFRFTNVRYFRARGHGMRFGGRFGQYPNVYANPMLLHCGGELANRHGIWFQGPSDYTTVELAVTDSGQEADDTWAHIRFDTRANGRHFHLHPFANGVGGAPQMASWAVESVSGNNEFFGAHMEGARRLYRHAAGAGPDRLVGCKLYAHNAGANPQRPVVLLEASSAVLDAATRIENTWNVAGAIGVEIGVEGGAAPFGLHLACNVVNFGAGTIRIANSAGGHQLVGRSFSNGPLFHPTGAWPQPSDMGRWTHAGGAATEWRGAQVNDGSGASATLAEARAADGAVVARAVARRNGATQVRVEFSTTASDGTLQTAGLALSGNGTALDKPLFFAPAAVVGGSADFLFGGLLAGGNARRVLLGDNLSFGTDGSGNAVLNATGTGGGGGAPTTASYLTLGADAGLSNERVFAATAPLQTADGGAGQPFTLSLNRVAFTALADANGLALRAQGRASDDFAGVRLETNAGASMWTWGASSAAQSEFYSAGTVQYRLTTGGFQPVADNARELGASGARWSQLWAQLPGDAATADLVVMADSASGRHRHVTAAQFRARANVAAASHNHTASEVTDFAEAVDDRVAALLQAGSNVTLTYNDAANTLTIAAAGGGGATNLTYNAATRTVESDTGTDAVLPLVSASAAGLAPAFPNNTTTFLRGDGTYAAPVAAGGLVIPASARSLTNQTRGLPPLCRSANVTEGLTARELKCFVAFWPWQQAVNRARVRINATIGAGTGPAFEVGVYSLTGGTGGFGDAGFGSRVARFDTWATNPLTSTAVQVSGTVADVTLDPGWYVFAVWADWTGGTAPNITATGEPSPFPSGIAGNGLAASTRYQFAGFAASVVGGLPTTLPALNLNFAINPFVVAFDNA